MAADLDQPTLPDVSVVIPTYESAAWVEKTLESVVSQTYSHEKIEIVVVDDASLDDSVRIVQSFLGTHSIRGRVAAQEKNAGLASPGVGLIRNIGWRMARGEWIQFLDSDDLLSPHKIALQAECASRVPHDVAVVYSNWQALALENGEWQPAGPVHRPSVDEDPVVRILEEPSFGYLGPALIRRAFLEQIGGFIERRMLGQDLDLMLRIAMAGGRFVQVHSKEAAFFIRLTPNSLWKASLENKGAMRMLLATIRSADQFLCARNVGGALSLRERRALAWRYARFVDRYLETDEEAFHEIMAWFEQHRLRYPPGASLLARSTATLVGFERALRLRSAYRRVRRLLG
jgi:glycosyltransferase involved in cell wall biosynthesis